MKRVTGDLVQLACSGQFDVIVHGCNCKHTMGAGLAWAIRCMWPEVYNADQMTRPGVGKLGEIVTVPVKANMPNFQSHDLIVVNAYTQAGYGRNGKHLDARALFSCLVRIDNLFGGGKMRIGLPLIGCGLAGGDWSTLKSVINELFGSAPGDHYTLVALPGQEPEMPWTM